MFSFRKDDVAKLIELSIRDHKNWDAVKARIEKIKPAWTKLQIELEDLCARSECFSATVTHDAYHPWWHARNAQLEAQIAAKLAERDGLITDLASEFEAVKTAVFRRNSSLTGAFVGWAGQVAAGLPKGNPLKAELENARRQVDEMVLGPVQPIIDLITGLVERVEADESIDAPIFKFARLVTLALGETPLVQAASGIETHRFGQADGLR